MLTVRAGLAAAVLGCCLGSASSATVPRRIVSLNLCADELVLRLADKGAVASVTWLAADPHQSTEASSAKAIALNHGLAEEVLAFAPDLIIAGQHTTHTTVALLKQAHVPVLVLGVPNDVATVEREITTVADAVGQSERGRALVTDMNKHIAALAAARPAHRPTALVVQPNGFTVGRGSLLGQPYVLPWTAMPRRQ